MRILDDYDEEFVILRDYVKRQAANGNALAILEAGCGRWWELPLDGIDYELTGIDMDAAALSARTSNRGDLVRAIVGDLRTAQLPHSQYDVIYNSFVLEHVAGAEDVLVNFTRWVRPGGIIILRIPDPNSAYGFMARWTPFKVHVLFYRYVVGIKDAGRRGFGPYPTVYDPIVSREGVRRFCAEHGLVIREELGNGSYHQGRGLFKYALPCVARIINWLSLGRIHSDFTSLTYVVEKPLQSRKPN